MKTNSWISYSVFLLGSIAAASVMGTLARTLMHQPVSEVIITLGLVAFAGLLRLLVSPLNQGRLDFWSPPT